MLIIEFNVLFKDIVIVEGFDSLSLLQNLLQYFIKNHLPLQVSVHLYMSLVGLPLYFIFRLVYITNIFSKFL
jgi:hypothetical protein